jgi:hypothetical protein
VAFTSVLSKGLELSRLSAMKNEKNDNRTPGGVVSISERRKI